MDLACLPTRADWLLRDSCFTSARRDRCTPCLDPLAAVPYPLERPPTHLAPLPIQIMVHLAHAPCLQVQVLTLNGEPRMILPIPAAGGLCGICSDGRRVFVTDIDTHKIHVLRLTNERRVASQAARSRVEADMRRDLRAAAEGSISSPAVVEEEGQAHMQQRREKEAQRDLVLQRVRSAPRHATIHRVLGLSQQANRAEVMQAIRLALRLLHPDRSMNLSIRGTARGKQLEAAFKRVNNMKDDL
jgi:hypothetical protein